MKKYIFPYGFKLSFKGGKIATFPAIGLTMMKENSSEEFSFLVLVDSGAEISLFTKGDAELLGLSLETGEKINIGTVSGDRFSAFLHPIIIKIGEEKFRIKVAFSANNDTPRVLGRNPIFSKFFIIFDEERKNTIFISREDKTFKNIIYQ